MRPSREDLLTAAHVVSLPLRVPFRGLSHREAVIIRGALGWTEFAPFDDYSDAESVAWLDAAIEYGWTELPPLHRDEVLVNATIPAVPADEVASVLSRFPGCRTAKVKVGGAGTTRADDVARVRAVREAMGPEGRIRVDANGAWNVDEAERTIRDLAEFDLEYVEQPCASLAEMREIHQRLINLDVSIAADESIRRASDPLEVARLGGADILVLKVAPLGGITPCLDISRQTNLPIVVSSALDTSVGLSMGAHLAAALPELELDCGLGTGALLAADVTAHPLLPIDGRIPVARPDVSTALLEKHAASAARTLWWRERLSRVYDLL